MGALGSAPAKKNPPDRVVRGVRFTIESEDQGDARTDPGSLTRPRAGRPLAALTAVAPTGATQKKDPTVGWATPLHGASSTPETFTSAPMTPLPGKHGR